MNRERVYRVTLDLTRSELIAMQELFPPDSISGMVQGAFGYYLGVSTAEVLESYKKISGAFWAADKVVVVAKRSKSEEDE